MDYLTFVNSEVIARNCREKLRPNSSHGLWLCTLIPIAYMVNNFKHHANTLQFEYKISTIIAFGLLIQSVCIFLKLARTTKFSTPMYLLNTLSAGSVTSFLLWICLRQDIMFSVLIGFFTMIFYRCFYFYILRRIPQSLTLGEAYIVVQGCTLFFVNTFLKFVDYTENLPETTMQKMTTVLQVTFVGVTIIIGLTYSVIYFRGILFYGLTLFVVGAVLLFPLSNDIIFVALFKFIFEDLKRISMICIWIGLLGLTGSAIAWHIKNQHSSTTRTRKFFHILISIVFIPGFLFQCTFLYLVSGLLLAAFMILETVRVIQLPPFGDVLQQIVRTFVDDKDAGNVALTPIYLLVGCCLPLWIHPYSCDLTDSVGLALLPLLSGVISVGIGDTVASIVGSKYGQHKWQGTTKSIEGTLTSIFAQFLVLPTFIFFGYVNIHIFKVIGYVAAVVINSLIEAKTDQVDNLVLPLVTYCLLSF